MENVTCDYYVWTSIGNRDDSANWNSCSLISTSYNYGYKIPPISNKNKYETMIVGISQCLQNNVQHEWCNGCINGKWSFDVM
jgi:hypothetical protein